MDFWRLAEQAERTGIRIFVEPVSGEHFATSGSDPTRLYRLTGFRCTCAGFTHWQRCQHHSLLLAQLGWLPDPDPPAPTAPAAIAAAVADPPCWDCAGRGWERVQGASGAWYRLPCLGCAGTGRASDDGDEAVHDPGEPEARRHDSLPGRVIARPTDPDLADAA
jgi:hypothetical protein